MLAAITVGNATDIVSPTADTSSIAALIASDGGDGVSLREAVTAANNTAGEDAITFDASVFTGGDNNLIRFSQLTGELSINDSLSIDGAAVGGVVIAANPSGYSRVLNFSASLGSLTLQDLTITGGRLGGSTSASFGGGIRSLGDLTLINSTVSGNLTLGAGGGIYVSDGDVSLINTAISGNVARYFGGGISNSNGNVFLTNSTVSENGSFGRENIRGGGISNLNGNVSLTNSTVSGNSASLGGGGIYRH